MSLHRPWQSVAGRFKQIVSDNGKFIQMSEEVKIKSDHLIASSMVIIFFDHPLREYGFRRGCGRQKDHQLNPPLNSYF